jgi:hypothetical protein
MPITFDTLDELKAFMNRFHLQEKQTSDKLTGKTRSNEENVGAVVRVGRKEKMTKPGRRGKMLALETEVSPGKRGRKPKLQAKAPQSKRERGETLTAKIQESVRKALGRNQSFTANDIYDDLIKRNPEINKQSVITSVLKQMNSTFSTISVSECAGKGPRPVKLYNS